MGVSVEKGKYRARVYHKGKRYTVGMYDTELKAKRAVNRFKRKLVEQDDFFIKDSSLSDYKLSFEDIPRKNRLTRLGIVDRLSAKLREWKS